MLPQDQPATAPTAQPATQGTATTVAAPAGGYSAREMYEAAQLHRRTLRDQLSSTENVRQEIAQELQNPLVTGVNREGMEARLKVVDIKVLDLSNSSPPRSFAKHRPRPYPALNSRRRAISTRIAPR